MSLAVGTRINASLEGIPSATTGRFLLLVTAVLGTAGYSYRVILIRSAIPYGAAMAVGMAAVVISTLLVYLLLPALQQRVLRLHDLADGGASPLVEHVHTLAHNAGIAKPPRVVMSRSNRCNAQVFGRYSRYFLCLNYGLVQRFHTDRPAFDATVRHELAHLLNRDVDMSRLTIAMAWAFPVTVVIPYLTTVHDLAQFVVEDLWRIGLLIVVVYLLFVAVLRARELHADARAAQLDGSDGALSRVLEGTAHPSRSWRWLPGWLRNAVSAHPSVPVRQLVLRAPEALDRPSFWVAVATGVTAGIAALPLGDLVSNLIGGYASIGRSIGGGIAVGFLITIVISPMLWRTAQSARARRPPLMESLSVVIGTLIGAEIALQVGTTGPARLGYQLPLVEVGFGGILAALQAGLALWSMRTASALLGPRQPMPRRRLLFALLVTGGAYSGAWTVFLWMYREVTETPANLTMMATIRGVTVGSPPSVWDQLVLLRVGLETAVVQAPVSFLPLAGVMLVSMACLLTPVALALRGQRLWTSLLVGGLAAGAGMLVVAPFLQRLLARAADLASIDPDRMIRAHYLWAFAPMLVLELVVAGFTTWQARRAGFVMPAMAGMVGAAVAGGFAAVGWTVGGWIWLNPYTTALLVIAVVGVPIVASVFTVPVAKLVLVTSAPPIPGRRVGLILVPVICLIAAGGFTGARAYAPKWIPVTSPSLDQVTEDCIVGDWVVMVHTLPIRIGDDPATAIGGQGMTWTFTADGNHRWDSNHARLDVAPTGDWPKLGWVLVYEGWFEGNWRVHDERLLLTITASTGTQTLLFTPLEQVIGEAHQVAHAGEEDSASVSCTKPLMEVIISDAKFILSRR